MCGPSEQEKSIQGRQTNLSLLLQDHFNERFGAQSQVLQNLNDILTPIAEAGPDQQGFGSQELAALNTQAGEGVGRNYAKAEQSLNTVLGSRGGGNEQLPTGSEGQLRAVLASQGANELSQEQLGITRANYAQGRQNWQQATGGLAALANQYDPTAFSGQAQKGFDSSFGMANTIAQQQGQMEGEIAGGIASLAMGGASFGAGALGGGGFDFAGGLQALTGKG
jgi:hypothetical protein